MGVLEKAKLLASSSRSLRRASKAVEHPGPATTVNHAVTTWPISFFFFLVGACASAVSCCKIHYGCAQWYGVEGQDKKSIDRRIQGKACEG